jgi:hypothetical protein
VSLLVTVVPPLEALAHSEGRTAALAAVPSTTEAKDTNGNAEVSGAAQACTLQATVCESADETLHRPWAVGVSGARKTRCCCSRPAPQAAEHTVPGAAAHAVKAHWSAALTGVSEALEDIEGELEAVAAAVRVSDGLWLVDELPLLEAVLVSLALALRELVALAVAVRERVALCSG